MENFNFNDCGANEHALLIGYHYALEAVICIWIAALFISNYKKLTNIHKKPVMVITFGLLSFLFPFFLLSGIATYLVYEKMNTTFLLEPYGLFGFPVFIASIVYSIVKYKIFGIKIQESLAIVIALFILVGSQLFYIKKSTDTLITAVTLIFTIIFGLMLIKSIRQADERKRLELEKINEELQQHKEHLELVNKELERDKKIVETANKELINLDTAKTEFINIASHQLRTPTTVIKGISSMMTAGTFQKFSEEDQSKFYQSLWNKSKKLESIINDILSAASLTNRKYTIEAIECQNVDMKELLETIIQDFDAELQDKKLKLEFRTEEKLPAIKGQKEDLEDAFENLLNNAIKYTPSKGEKTGVIRIEIKKSSDALLISIADNGIGIPKDEISKLFTKFYRAANAKHIYTDGSGLGLFIAKEIIEGHGGKVWVESQLNQGTTFFVQLPIIFSNCEI